MEGNNDFVKTMKNDPYSEEENDEEEKYYFENHTDELRLFIDDYCALDYLWLEDYSNPDFNIDSLTEEQKAGYLKIVEFYKDKIDKSVKAETYASKHIEDIPQSTNYDWEKEPQGEIKVYPGSNEGLGFVYIKDPKTNNNSIKSVFPFISEGYEYPCSIQNIKLDYLHNEGEIEAFIDEDENLLVNFYDIHFLDNRKFYNPDDTFNFILMGLASNVEVVENDDMISMEQDQDNIYEIYSVVRAINKYSDNINGEKVWRMTIVLGFTPDGEDIPLDVYLTQKSLLDNEPLPEEGDNVYLTVHIQGYLYNIEK